MKLTAAQRSDILRGQHPRIAFQHPDECDLEQGEIIVLRSSRGLDADVEEANRHEEPAPSILEVPRVWIEIKALRRVRTGGVVVDYLVRDDTPHFLAPGNGYTSSPIHSPDKDAERVDPAYQKRIATEAAVASSMRREQQRKMAEKLHYERRLNDRRKRLSRTVVHTLESRLAKVTKDLNEAA